MMDFLIEAYVRKLTPKDIINFAELHNIPISFEEAEYIIPYIKYNWRVFLNGDPNPLLGEIQKKVSAETFEKYVKLIVILRNFLEKFQS